MFTIYKNANFNAVITDIVKLEGYIVVETPNVTAKFNFKTPDDIADFYTGEELNIVDVMADAGVTKFSEINRFVDAAKNCFIIARNMSYDFDTSKLTDEERWSNVRMYMNAPDYLRNMMRSYGSFWEHDDWYENVTPEELETFILENLRPTEGELAQDSFDEILYGRKAGKRKAEKSIAIADRKASKYAWKKSYACARRKEAVKAAKHERACLKQFYAG